MERAETPLAVDGSADAEQGLRSLLAQQSSMHHVLYLILELCADPCSSEEIDAAVAARMPRTSVYSPAVLREWLERAGGLERVTSGECPGSTSDASDGSEHSQESTPPRWQTTAAGLATVGAMAPSKLFRDLLEGPDASYAHIYARVLEFCQEAPRSKNEIEDLVGNHPDLQNPVRYASYFINRLGEVGAIEWNGKWSTTETGRAAIVS